MRLLLLAVLFLALVAAVPAEAQDCRAPVRYATPYVAPAVVEKKIVVETISPVVATAVQFVQVPLYAATYLPAPALVPGAVAATPAVAAAPSAAAPAAPAAAPAQDAVLAALARLETRLDRLERGPATPPAVETPADPFAPQVPAVPMPPAEPQARADPVTGLLSARCAACHDRPVADQKGGGLTLTEGGRLAALTPATRLAVWQQAHAGKMPRGGPRLAAAELAVLDRWLASP